MSIEAMKLALEALEMFCEHGAILRPLETVETLRQAIEQPEQEPVAWHEPDSFGNVTIYKNWALENGWKPLYTAPPKREWVGLTDEDKDELLNLDNWTDIVEAVEAKLKEKNA